MESTVRNNYIFVDYENVQELDLNLIAGKPVKVFLIIGKLQKSFPIELTKQVHKYHDQVQLLETETTGRNALDMVLAYHVGALASTDPRGFFHILSKDKDYDALVTHLRAGNILASRNEVFSKIPVLTPVKRFSLDERVTLVVERFTKTKATRPKRLKTLITNIHSICQKELSAEDAQRIVDAMVARKLIELTPQGGVIYKI